MIVSPLFFTLLFSGPQVRFVRCLEARDVRCLEVRAARCHPTGVLNTTYLENLFSSPLSSRMLWRYSSVAPVPGESGCRAVLDGVFSKVSFKEQE